MKLKVNDVVTMAWNDHRISAENEDVKIDITVKSTIKKNSLLDLKKGDKVEFQIGDGAESKSANATTIPTEKNTVAEIKSFAEEKGIELAPEHKTKAQMLAKIQAAVAV